MTTVHADLLAVIDAVHIDSRSSYRVNAEMREIADEPASSPAAERTNQLVDALANDIYALLYCRPTGTRSLAPHDELARRDHMTAVAAANSGRGTWEAGWTVRQLESTNRVTVTKGDVAFEAPAAGVHPSIDQLVPGAACRLWVPKELRSLIPGFYMALGDGDQRADGAGLFDGPVVRFYWHLTPRAAQPFIALTTSHFNAQGIPFQAKVLSDPAAYTRADAGVLYLSHGDLPRVAAILAAIHPAISELLRPSVPLFTKCVARGLGYAHDPGGPLSFGQNRCRLAAEALCDAHERGHFDRDLRAQTLASIFRDRDLDPLRPHLGPGARDDLPFELPSATAGDRATGPTARNAISTAGDSHRLQSSILDTARRIGDALCRQAHFDREGRLCNWIGRSMTAETDRPGGPITPTAAALGPDLYAGSAGVALYLAQLFALTGDGEHRRTALAAIARSVHQLDAKTRPEVSPALSLFFGDLGVAWVARKVASHTGEGTLAEAADSLFDSIVAAAARPHLLDVMSGNAGAIPVFLELARETGLDRYRDLAILLGDELCRAATSDGSARSWGPDLASGPGMATVPLCGLSHGAAGIGLALFELYGATGRLDFLETARGAFEFEGGHFDPAHRNWRDHRTSFATNSPPSAWCHGAPGIALTRLRAAALDPDRAGVYLEEARVALATTLDAIDVNLAAPRSDASLCHGLAGLGEIALCAAQALEDETYLGRALTLAEALIDRHGAAADWPSGAPSRGPNPSLMLGLAGIGYWMLRLHAPRCVPSVLSFGS